MLKLVIYLNKTSLEILINVFSSLVRVNFKHNCRMNISSKPYCADTSTCSEDKLIIVFMIGVIGSISSSYLWRLFKSLNRPPMFLLLLSNLFFFFVKCINYSHGKACFHLFPYDHHLKCLRIFFPVFLSLFIS